MCFQDLQFSQMFNPEIQIDWGWRWPGESHTDASDLPTPSIHRKESMQSRKSKNQKANFQPFLMRNGDLHSAENPRFLILQDSRFEIAVNSEGQYIAHRAGTPLASEQTSDFRLSTTRRGVRPQSWCHPLGIPKCRVWVYFLFGNCNFQVCIMRTTIIRKSSPILQ